MRINVKELGAGTDADVLDTEIIQRAIDTVCGAGGGEVVFPAGNYHSGGLRLGDNLTLVLERGATLYASGDIDDYEPDVRFESGRLRHYFLSGFGIRNFRLCGDGMICGGGSVYWYHEYFNGVLPSEQLWNYSVYKPKPDRPVLIYLFDSCDIELSGINISDAPAYTVWLVGCVRVRIDGLTVRNNRRGPTTDALDIDCCCSVEIRNCDLNVGDDCVALKSDRDRIGLPRDCEDIVVSDCRFSSPTCAVRIGYEGDNRIRNCRFERLKIYDSRHGLDIVSVLPAVAPWTCIMRGAEISDIIFSDIEMLNVAQGFFIWAGNESPQTDYAGGISALKFRNIRIDEVCASYIGSVDCCAIRDLEFCDVSISLRCSEAALGWRRGDEIVVPNLWGGGFNLGVLCLHIVNGVNMDNVVLVCDNKAVPVLNWHGVENFLINGELQSTGGERY